MPTILPWMSDAQISVALIEPSMPMILPWISDAQISVAPIEPSMPTILPWMSDVQIFDGSNRAVDANNLAVDI
jgi:hypothetical protein